MWTLEIGEGTPERAIDNTMVVVSFVYTLSFDSSPCCAVYCTFLSSTLSLLSPTVNPIAVSLVTVPVILRALLRIQRDQGIDTHDADTRLHRTL